ncbi:Heme A synthase [Alphaproteobacteria bacterium SO-S41]|nr:Heme A synthase [Alphaproteobacteria bacterium SO-S41]
MRYHAPAFMSITVPPSRPSRAVIVWLAVVLAMVAAIVVVGGLTRLTESGLSITEWKPISGVIPPLSDADWQAELEKYRSTTQYQVVNQGMSVEQFKTIFWWEWGHRLLARAIGLVVLLPLLWFGWRGTLAGAPLRRGWVLFGLVCFQGLIGWLMVVSGLVGRLEVSQYRLAAHLGVAFIIFGWTLSLMLNLLRREARARLPGLTLATAVVVAVFVQILLGALVAGLDAGLTYNTWPLMDGHIVPDGLFIAQPWWANFGENVTLVQFQHRTVAYAIALLVAAAAFIAGQKRAGAGTAGILVFAVVVQIALGIYTLLAGAGGEQPIVLGAMHQSGALALFAAAIAHRHALNGSKAA